MLLLAFGPERLSALLERQEFGIRLAIGAQAAGLHVRHPRHALDELRPQLRGIADQNKVMRSFIGTGYHGSARPVLRLGRPDGRARLTGTGPVQSCGSPPPRVRGGQHLGRTGHDISLKGSP